jgi:hypothetical protein
LTRDYSAVDSKTKKKGKKLPIPAFRADSAAQQRKVSWNYISTELVVGETLRLGSIAVS